MRRPSKSLLDDLEHFAEEQEASEHRDEDFYDEEEGQGVSDDNLTFESDGEEEEVEYGYEEVDYNHEEEEDEVTLLYGEDGGALRSNADGAASSIRSGNSSSLDPLYEAGEDLMSSARSMNESSRSFGTGTTPPGSASFSLASATSRQQGDAMGTPSPSRRDIHRSVRATRTSFITAPRKSTFGGSASSKDSVNHRESLAEAAERLGSAESNTQWENVMAAAAVVAASSHAPVKRSHVQFGRGDHVLVMLTLLNITSPEDVSKELFSVDPVNVFGYPRSEGHSDADRQGPFSYVLCKVQQVHFEEDQRYYTVLRLDTETEQRAEPGWMEALKTTSSVGDNFERALLAAQRTARSMAGREAAPKAEPTGGWSKLRQLVRTRLIPWYMQSRTLFKKFVADLLHGNEEYSVQLHCTGINLLVMCSLVYVFIDVVALAYLPTDMDKPVAITAIIVWCVLVMELFFEFLIRPSTYFDLMRSDKKFAPTTARHINRFHLFFETCGLIMYLPSIGCSFTDDYCWDNIWFNHIDAVLYANKSTDRWKAAWSRFSLGLIFLRCFCLLRHWKQMWIITMFKEKDNESLFIRKLLLADRDKRKKLLKRKQKNDEDDTENNANVEDNEKLAKKSNENDNELKDAATIGTALMLINSHRALVLGLFVATVFPMIQTLGTQNAVVENFVDLLQANNRASPTNSTADCSYLESAITSFLLAMTPDHGSDNLVRTSDSYLLWAQLLPVRCDWQDPDGVITFCPANTTYADEVPICEFWKEIRPRFPENATTSFFAETIDVRSSEVTAYERSGFSDLTGDATSHEFYVRAVFDESNTVAVANSAIFLHTFGLLMLTLIGLTVMRGDADRLVLGPLQRMLKIVVKYADDPLSQTASTTSKHDGEVEKEQLGNYETEQLINAIAKIADLLRKCWGVAGAGIISTNLARTKDGQTVVFNPTVPGKRVYALFGFVAINDFGKQLRALDRDVMRLINDVARVVHDEVYRWSLGDRGQCNKNLGPAFLMVFRIGDSSEVHDKKKRATDVVFNSQMKKNIRVRRRRTSNTKRRTSGRHFDLGKDGTLQLASLPGIQSFADRALLGMLKSFAGIHRDRSLVEWQHDFRLGAGVGAFKVNVIYGMDAGWAVEGAVGSEYKIDATYLSPHVNMASRMMSACKQYGVTVLLSQAVEELLSKTARTMLRHLDTVYVKGSSVPQRIYTYDARFDGVDFFLFERSPEQADVEADSYSPSIWETDQDLRSMRQHVTDAFVAKFHDGVELYLEGRWKEAVETLQDADDLMLQTVLEEGYVDYKADDLGGKIFDRHVTNEEAQRIRNEFGDGACKCLLQYMQRRKCIPPNEWHGVRKLMSK